MTPDELETKNANIHRITIVPSGPGYLARWDGEPIQAYGASPWLAFHAAEVFNREVSGAKRRLKLTLVSYLLRCIIMLMKDTSDVIHEYFVGVGRKGGTARAKSLTKKRRKEIATIASRAAAIVRTKKAQERLVAK